MKIGKHDWLAATKAAKERSRRPKWTNWEVLVMFMLAALLGIGLGVLGMALYFEDDLRNCRAWERLQ